MTFRVLLARHASMTYVGDMTNHEAAGDLIGSAEAARLLGKSPRTIHRLVQSGELRPVVIAPGGFKGAYLFSRADVERLLNGSAA